MIDVKGITRRYGALKAVDDLSFRVAPGEVLGLVGPNGAGKTTTLRCIVGIMVPESGDICIDGDSIITDPIRAKRAVAFIPDEPRLFDHLTVDEHLRFISRVYNVDDAENRARRLLDELELTDRAKSLPDELSRGMKQKLAIACGLLPAPGNLIFDEPLTGLDPIGIRHMKETIRTRARQGVSVIVSSHLLHLVEEICDRVLVVKEGRKVIHGSFPELSAGMRGLKDDPSLEEIFLHVTGPVTEAG